MFEHYSHITHLSYMLHLRLVRNDGEAGILQLICLYNETETETCFTMKSEIAF